MSQLCQRMDFWGNIFYQYHDTCHPRTVPCRTNFHSTSIFLHRSNYQSATTLRRSSCLDMFFCRDLESCPWQTSPHRQSRLQITSFLCQMALNRPISLNKLLHFSMLLFQSHVFYYQQSFQRSDFHLWLIPHPRHGARHLAIGLCCSYHQVFPSALSRAIDHADNRQRRERHLSTALCLSHAIYRPSTLLHNSR